VIAAAMAVAALATITSETPVAAATAWWSPLALRGTAITAVSVAGTTVDVRTASGETLHSHDGGANFLVRQTGPLPAPSATVRSGPDVWSIDPTGQVLHGTNGVAATPDPGAPALGAGADLIAAPAAVPGVVVTVAVDGTVWRRGQDGDWKSALLLLPRSLVQGVPRVTSLTAFTEPLTTSVYLGTDGYAVLNSSDGGDDWIRAGPGLPDSVYALTTDSTTRTVFAGTSDGLWVHVLQTLPAPPAYEDAALIWRWVGISVITVLASVLAVLGLVRVLRPSRQ
jgi:hypothetical protein